jgi:hypothetical protein
MCFVIFALNLKACNNEFQQGDISEDGIITGEGDDVRDLEKESHHFRHRWSGQLVCRKPGKVGHT